MLRIVKEIITVQKDVSTRYIPASTYSICCTLLVFSSVSRHWCQVNLLLEVLPQEPTRDPWCSQSVWINKQEYVFSLDPGFITPTTRLS